MAFEWLKGRGTCNAKVLVGTRCPRDLYRLTPPQTDEQTSILSQAKPLSELRLHMIVCYRMGRALQNPHSLSSGDTTEKHDRLALDGGDPSQPRASPSLRQSQ